MGEIKNPKTLIPPHKVEDLRKYAQITADMAYFGWVYRPILAWTNERAITGSHRLAVACELEIDVSVIYLPDELYVWADDEGLIDGDGLPTDPDQFAAAWKKWGQYPELLEIYERG